MSSRIAVVASALVWAALACSTSAAQMPVSAVVTRVIDGDTVIVRTAQGEQPAVRLIGIDAPELGGGECGAVGATQALRALLDQRAVTLVFDPPKGSSIATGGG